MKEDTSGFSATPINFAGLWLCRDLDRLIETRFEHELRRANIFSSARPWERSRENGLFVDLSKVKWFERVTLARLVALIDSAIAAGVEVFVALPPREKDESGRLKGVARFLTYVRFEAALLSSMTTHGASVWLIENLKSFDLNYDPLANTVRGSGGTMRAPIQEPDTTEYKYDFPLKWVRKSADATDLVRNFLARVISESHNLETSIPTSTATAIANVILHELVENVVDHANNTAGALIAAWVRAFTFDPDDYPSDESDYLRWMNGKTLSAIEIVVADGGVGLANTQLVRAFEKHRRPIDVGDDTASVMLWAFDRWSSGKEVDHLRGTRGLYRLNRVVRKQLGMITVRAAHRKVGFAYGNEEELRFVAKSSPPLANLPGTAVHVVLPLTPYRTVPRRRLSRPLDGEAVSLAAPPLTRLIRVGPLREGGLNATAEGQILKVLQESTANTHIIVVIEAPHNAPPSRREVEDVLRWAAGQRHPAALSLVGLPGGSAWLENAIDSVNEEHRRDEKHSEIRTMRLRQVWDPVLVLDLTLDLVGWVGVTSAVARLLDRLSDGHRHDLRSVVDADAEASRLREFIYNEAALFEISMDNASGDKLIALRITPTSVADEISRQFRSVANADSPLWPRSLYRTPSMMVIERWIDTASTLDRAFPGGPDAVAMIGARALRDIFAATHSTIMWLVHETSVNGRLVDVMAAALNAKRFAMPSDERGYGAILAAQATRNAKVVIVAEIAGSGDTLRRIVSEIVRAGLEATAILIVFDARLDRDGVVEYGIRRIPVTIVSTCDIGHVTADDERRVGTYIHPITKQAERSHPAANDADYAIGEAEMRSLASKRSALHFGHVGEPLGRHFTFYLDAGRVLEDARLTSALRRAINDWRLAKSLAASQLQFWYPAPEPKAAEPAKRLAQLFAREFGAVNTVAVQRERQEASWTFPIEYSTPATNGVVVVDWGVLSGTTLMQMCRLAASAGAKDILAVSVVSQMRFDDEEVLRSVASIAPRSVAPPQTLFAHPQKAPPAEKTNVAVHFVSRLQIASFGRASCPICATIDARHAIRPPSPWLVSQRDDVGHALRQRSRDEIAAAEPKDFFGEAVGVETMSAMLQIRGDFVASQRSTRKRFDLLWRLLRLANDEDGLRDRGVLVQFLGTEAVWLQQQPFDGGVFAQAIARLIAQTLAEKGHSEFVRWCAASVIRYAAIAPIADILDGIVGANITNDRIIAEVLLSLWHVIADRLDVTSEEYRSVAAKLNATIAIFEQHSAREVRDVVRLVASRASSSAARAEVLAEDERLVWRQLAEVLNKDADEHHGAGIYMAYVYMPHERELLRRTAMAVRSGTPLIDAWRSHLDDRVLRTIGRLPSDWSRCAEFIDLELLPRLRRLMHVVTGDEWKRAMSSDAENASSLIDSTRLISESTFSQLLARDIRSRPELLIDPDNWEIFERTTQWVYDGILKSGENNASRLRRFIASVPCVLGDVFAEAWDRVVSARIAPLVIPGSIERVTGSTYSIYCPRALAVDTCQQLLANVEKHRLVIGGVRQVATIDATATDENDRVTLTILNSGTEPLKHGKGIKELRLRLQPFQAHIQHGSPSDKSGWSYRAIVSFQKGVP